MWLVVARHPSPDAPYWVGRRWLAAADALAWPLLWGLGFWQVPAPVGVVAPMIIALAVVSACSRLHRALWVNHLYRFTTWYRCCVIAVLVGAVLKLTVPG